MAEQGLTVDALARRLAIERTRLNKFIGGSAVPNESLTRRLAVLFDQDVGEWLQNVQKPEADDAPVATLPAGFIKVATTLEVPEGRMKVVYNALAVVARAEGEFYAFGNVCPHAAGPIGEGVLKGCVVKCPWHAGRWDIRTGKALTLVATGDIPLFAVRVTGEDIEIRLNQAALTQGVVSPCRPEALPAPKAASHSD
jgi:nitrite reductase/ring-hydroxylating ferredoxin subunit